VQIVCCFENFCDKHIKEEILRNFTCPNCKVTATMRDIVPNKKLREDISWFKNLLTEAVEIKEPAPNNTIPSLKMGNVIAHLPNIQEEMQNSLKKLEIDIAVNKNDSDMTPEEKMHLFNTKLSEMTESKAVTEDKNESSVPNVNSADSKLLGSFPKHPDPNMMNYPSIYKINIGFDPRIYYQMMAGYPPYGMMPTMMPPGAESLLATSAGLKKKEESSSSSSSSSKSSSPERKKKKRHRSRSRSYSRDRDNKKKQSKRRDKDRDRDRADRDKKERHRSRSKDRHNNTSKKKKYK
jgi:hypothetical protein